MMQGDALLVAIDDGYAQTKLVGQPPEGGALLRRSFRSSVRPGRYGLGSLGGEGALGAYDTEEGESYTVSDDIEAEDTKFDGFHTSPMNRVLVNHALCTAGYGGRRVHLATGLPVGDFFSEMTKNEAKIAAKSANLRKAVRCVSSDARTAEIEDVFVGCQAVAAYVDWYLDDDLQPRREDNDQVAIVDVGGRTTDIAVVRNGRSIDHRFSGTENMGVLDVYESVARDIRRAEGTGDKYPLAVLDRAVRDGKIRLWGKDKDVSELVRANVVQFEARLAREVERRLGSGSMLSAIVLVGGGGALFRSVGERLSLRNAEVAEDPEFANARGLLKYVRLEMARRPRVAEVA